MRKLLTVIATAFVLTTTAAFADTETAAPAPQSEQQQTAAPTQALGVVNINSADAAQLALLPRVGVKTAGRIVEYRKEHGPFAKTTDLQNVKGFGDKTFELVKPYLAVDGTTTLATKIQGPRKPRAPRQ